MYKRIFEIFQEDVYFFKFFKSIYKKKVKTYVCKEINFSKNHKKMFKKLFEIFTQKIYSFKKFERTTMRS